MFKRTVTRVMIGVGFGLAAAIVAAVGLAFLCDALYLLLLQYMPAPLAAFVTGLIFLIVAALIGMIGASAARAKPVPETPATEAQRMAAVLGTVFGSEANTILTKHGVLISLVGGFALGASKSLRRGLYKLVVK